MSNEKLHLNIVTLMVTTVCTLRCKHCVIAIPHHKPVHFPKENIYRELKSFFAIVDYVDTRLMIQGGECFLHPDIDEIILEATKYSRQFDHLLFVVNSTNVPRTPTLEILRNLHCNYRIRVDDYGKLSAKYLELVETLEHYRINYEIRPYKESDSYSGGWVDTLGEYKFHDYSSEQLQSMFATCLFNHNCKFIWGGKLWACGMNGSGVLLGKVPLHKADVLDLYSNELSITEKRKIIAEMGEKPYLGCNYCNGFDPQNSPRVLPAIQTNEGATL
jgi:hypothetical protein